MPATLQYHRSSAEADTAALIRDMMTLDCELYGDIGEDHLGGFEYWLERFARCPEFLSLARKPDGVLAGYYQFMPVTAAFAEAVRAGGVRDGQIPADALVPYSRLGEPYQLYLCSMAVRPEYRKRGVASRLWREEVVFQRAQRVRGARLGALVSVVWSACGARFFERIGVPRVGCDAAGRPVHRLELPGGELPDIPVAVGRRELLPQAA